MTAFGVGLRPAWFADLEGGRQGVDFLEIVSENFAGIGGATRRMLERLRADYDVALHGVSLSIAGQDPLDERLLGDLESLVAGTEPLFVTDHLAWTSWKGHESHDLLPLPLTKAMLDHVARRVHAVQERLGRRLYLENATAYVAFRASEMDEADFLAELCRRSGCGVLLDVNNLYVNSCNLGLDPEALLAGLDPQDVAYMHVAGHQVLPDVRIDTHDEAVGDPVWDLYRRACARFPQAGTVLERDGEVPPLSSILAELDRARRVHASAASARGGAAGSRPARGIAGPCPTPAADAWTQEAFFASVVSPTGSAPPPGLLADDGPVPAARGLAVYRDAYRSRLHRGLASNFPALRRVLGASAFAEVVGAFLERHPPASHRFGEVGAALPVFLRTYRFPVQLCVPPDAVADLAAVEQAELEVADAPDDEAAPLATASLAQVGPEDWLGLRVRLATALRLVRCAVDVLPALSSSSGGGETSAADGADGAACAQDPARAAGQPLPGPIAVLVYRCAGEVGRERLAETEAAVVERLLGGATLGEAGEDDPEAAASALVRLTMLGLVLSLEQSSPAAGDVSPSRSTS